ncbi:MAG: PIN domain-containing protein [Actinomycetia bacterium]|nr:PIN domain-containing protein [Actinomycetes bacterium]
MTLLVDTSVWSLAFRRDAPPAIPEVELLHRALAGQEDVVSVGVIVLEVLRGFLPRAAGVALAEQFASLRLLEPARDDYIAAAGLSNTCRRAGVQLATIDALIAQMAIAHDVTLLTADQDFVHAAAHIPLRVWKPA